MMALRLTYAHNLLLDSHESVEDIAALAGFSDATAFIRAFKAEYGVTPKQFRMTRNESGELKAPELKSP